MRIIYRTMPFFEIIHCCFWVISRRILTRWHYYARVSPIILFAGCAVSVQHSDIIELHDCLRVDRKGTVKCGLNNVTCTVLSRNWWPAKFANSLPSSGYMLPVWLELNVCQRYFSDSLAITRFLQTLHLSCHLISASHQHLFSANEDALSAQWG